MNTAFSPLLDQMVLETLRKKPWPIHQFKITNGHISYLLDKRSCLQFWPVSRTSSTHGNSYIKLFPTSYNLTRVTGMIPRLAGIGQFHYLFPVSDDLITINYAAVLAMKVHHPTAGGEPLIRFNFKNGRDEKDITFRCQRS